jgi:(p)ppGpp synthase/HD superfamily hydrolase
MGAGTCEGARRAAGEEAFVVDDAAVARAERFVRRVYQSAGQPQWRADHALQVGDLLAELGCSDMVVTVGVLHDVLEDTDTTRDEVAEAFGGSVADLVAGLSEDASILDYRERKRALRASVQRAGRSAMLIFAADKLARLRTADEDGASIEPRQLEHYQRSLELLVASGIRSAQVDELRRRLRLRRGRGSTAAGPRLVTTPRQRVAPGG